MQHRISEKTLRKSMQHKTRGQAWDCQSDFLQFPRKETSFLLVRNSVELYLEAYLWIQNLELVHAYKSWLYQTRENSCLCKYNIGNPSPQVADFLPGIAKENLHSENMCILLSIGSLWPANKTVQCITCIHPVVWIAFYVTNGSESWFANSYEQIIDHAYPYPLKTQ